jgi:plasmid stabilization system protein ParE
VSIKVLPTSKAMSDLSVIAAHVKKHNDAAAARRIVNALLDEAERLGQEHFHRLGEELDGYDGPPAREVHRWVCLAGRFELHYEVLPAYAEEPAAIAILRVWDTRQDR